MKQHHLLAAGAVGLAVAAAVATIPVPKGEHAGSERWAVKTLADPDAPRVNLTPVATTVEALVARSRPAKIPANGRTIDELQVVRVTATVWVLKHEADGDLHLGLRGDSGAVMIAEVPDPALLAPTNPWFKQITATRAAALTLQVPARVTLTGIVFWDYDHGQVSVAPRKGIEVHPALGLEVR